MALVTDTRPVRANTEVVTFPRLDYWSMLDLFDRIPVHDLVRLNGLASWWSGYVTKVCRTKRDITVQCGHKLKGSGDRTQDQFKLLKVTSIHSHASDRLAQLLPNITSLEIIVESYQFSHNDVIYDIADITHLISKWSHQLVNLKIKCHSLYALPKEPKKRTVPIKQLLLSLNAITSLRQLSINCFWWQWTQMQDPIDLSILSQLEYFYFHTGWHDFENLWHSLVLYAGPNHQLKKIVMPSAIWSLPRNVLREHQLLSKFTTLKLGDHNLLTRDHWQLFPNLTTVDLGYVHSRSKFMRHITDMKSLKLVRTLKMELYITRDFNRHLDQVPADLPQLPSVTNLKLSIRSRWHTTWCSSFKSLKLGTILPNLKSVYLGCDFRCITSSYRAVKWTAKICSKISYRMFKLGVLRQLPGVECTFKKPILYSIN